MRGAAFLSCALLAAGLDNGVGRVPARGWSSWYSAPAGGSGVTDAMVRANAEALVSSGLAAKGYTYVNVDEGWLGGRYANGSLFELRSSFPYGMKALGDYVRSLETAPGSGERLAYGLYSCRGSCQCSTSSYSGPGSAGHEAADTAWMIAAGATWLKIDSCCASQDHATAFADYARFRDAMNASGVPVFFNLCGWSPWYAPPDPALNYSGGGSLGNSWRISGDGASYAAITATANVMASFGGRFSAPGGYSDADNILGPHGTVGVVSEAQARAQMILWSLFPSQLILGEDLTRASAEYLATVGNEELLAVNADAPYAGGAVRVAGGDLAWPCALPPGALYALRALPCAAGGGGGGGDAAPLQRWAFEPSDGSLRLASPPPGAEGARAALAPGAAAEDGALVYVFPPGAGGAADLAPPAAGTVRGPGGKCLDEYMLTTPRVDIWSCVGQANEVWQRGAGGTLVNNDSSLCLTAAPPGDDCTNVWARPLHDGGLALAFVNNAPQAAVVECGAACFAAANASGAPRWRVRDMIAHAELGVITPPFALQVNVSGGGAGAALRLYPA